MHPHWMEDQPQVKRQTLRNEMPVIGGSAAEPEEEDSAPVFIVLFKKSPKRELVGVVDDSGRDPSHWVPALPPPMAEFLVLCGCTGDRLIEAAHFGEPLRGQRKIVGSKELLSSAAAGVMLRNEGADQLAGSRVWIAVQPIQYRTASQAIWILLKLRYEGLKPSGGWPAIIVNEDQQSAASRRSSQVPRFSGPTVRLAQEAQRYSRIQISLKIFETLSSTVIDNDHLKAIARVAKGLNCVEARP